jgi:ankyrin repeat protein
MMLRVDRSVCPLLVQGLRIAGPILCMVLSTGLNAASQTDLVEAVKSGDISAVRDLLSAKVDVNVTQGDGATALHWAAYRDDLESAELLIAAGADVDVANDLGVTPLALASANPTASLAEKLLDFGADPHFASEIGVTPLMEAARTGNVAAMQALLDRGASVNAVESAREQTALMWAVSERHPEIVKALLENGADVSVRSLTRIRMVKLDSRGGGRRSPEVATPLELGGSTSLVFAARVGDVESTRLLLEAGANVDAIAADGNSALVMAAFADYPEVVEALLEAGANADTFGGGYTALHVAALRGNLQTVETLLAHGADPNLQVVKGSRVNRFGVQWAISNGLIGATPLLVATAYLEVEIMQSLVDGGADISVALPNGTTPLLAAAGTNVERQTRPSDQVRAGDTNTGYRTLPREADRILEAIEVLVAADADVNQTNKAGDTALHAAAGGALLPVIQLLADSGADLNATNDTGQTPLSMTTGGGGRGGPSPEQRQAGDLLRKLGASN